MIHIDELSKNFAKYFFCEAKEYFFAPGRVNLIGEHIDYNGGWVLPAAISRGMSAAVVFDNTSNIEIWSQNFNEKFTIDLNNRYVISEFKGWKKFVLASLQVLKDEKLPLSGAKVFIDSDLPIGAGLSSSAAFESLLAYIFAENVCTIDRKKLALLTQRAEVDYVGVQCGIMDQYAVAFGKKNYAMLLDCKKLQHEYIEADFGKYTLVLMNSNKVRTLQDSKYNIRRMECEKALSIINKFHPVTELVQAHEMSLSHIEDDSLYARALHVVGEQLRVERAVQALKVHNINYFGELLMQSHYSLAENYEVTGFELDTLVDVAMRSNRCVGARMTGAGFGGCCLAMVEKGEVANFERYVKKKYKEKTGLFADIFEVDIVDGVGRYT